MIKIIIWHPCMMWFMPQQLNVKPLFSENVLQHSPHCGIVACLLSILPTWQDTLHLRWCWVGSSSWSEKHESCLVFFQLCHFPVVLFLPNCVVGSNLTTFLVRSWYIVLLLLPKHEGILVAGGFPFCNLSLLQQQILDRKHCKKGSEVICQNLKQASHRAGGCQQNSFLKSSLAQPTTEIAILKHILWKIIMTPLQFLFQSITFAFLLRGLVKNQELVKVQFTFVMADQKAVKLPEVAINSVLRGWNLNIFFFETDKIPWRERERDNCEEVRRLEEAFSALSPPSTSNCRPVKTSPSIPGNRPDQSENWSP